MSIVIISNNDKQFIFDKRILIENCIYFEKANDLERNEMFEKLEILPSTFDEKTISLFKNYLLTDELELLAEYYSCKKLQYEFECKSIIFPIYKIIKDNIEDYKDYINDGFLKALLSDKEVIEIYYKTIKKYFMNNVKQFRNEMIEKIKTILLPIIVEKICGKQWITYVPYVLEKNKLFYLSYDKIYDLICLLIDLYFKKQNITNSKEILHAFFSKMPLSPENINNILKLFEDNWINESSIKSN